MGHKPKLPAFVGMFLALSALLGGAPSPAASPSESSPPAPEAIESRTATVHGVDTRARSLAVLTGVGHAVRLLRTSVSPECQIKVAGAAARLKDLKPGDIVRMTYRKSADRMEAVTIETVPLEASGGQR